MGGVIRKIVKQVGLAPDAPAPKPAPAPVPAPKPAPAVAAPAPVQPKPVVPEPVQPAGVVYGGGSSDMGCAAAGKPKRKKASTIATSARGVVGDAPVTRKSLLGS